MAFSSSICPPARADRAAFAIVPSFNYLIAIYYSHAYAVVYDRDMREIVSELYSNVVRVCVERIADQFFESLNEWLVNP